MAKCEYCDSKFDVEEAEEYFEDELLLSYHNIKKSLCGKCAVDAIEGGEEGIYFDTCENCGKTFDFVEDEYDFSQYTKNDPGADYKDMWDNGILCAQCAFERYDGIPIG